jgi:hypothetical protein
MRAIAPFVQVKAMTWNEAGGASGTGILTGAGWCRGATGST